MGPGEVEGRGMAWRFRLVDRAHRVVFSAFGVFWIYLLYRPLIYIDFKSQRSQHYHKHLVGLPVEWVVRISFCPGSAVENCAVLL